MEPRDIAKLITEDVRVDNGLISEERDPECEKRILASRSQSDIFDYAYNVIKGRWPEAEPIILKDPWSAFDYAHDIIKGRWPEAERHILKDAGWSSIYARDVIGGRWPEAESVILRRGDPGVLFHYARDVIQGRWPEAESRIVRDPMYACMYAMELLSDRWPEAEPTIIKDPWASFMYARDVIGHRWPEFEEKYLKEPDVESGKLSDVDEWGDGSDAISLYRRFFGLEHDLERDLDESVISEMPGTFRNWFSYEKDPEREKEIIAKGDTESAYYYARVNGRWGSRSKIEQMIMHDPDWNVHYARDVIGGRWPEAEPIIMGDPKLAYYYVREVIGDRWPEAEPVVLQNPVWAFYYAAHIIGERWPEFEEKYLKEPDSSSELLSDTDEWEDNFDPIGWYKSHFHIT